MAEVNPAKREEKEGKGAPIKIPERRPSYFPARLEIFQAARDAYVKQVEELSAKQTPIKVTLPDGSVKDGIAFKTTPYNIAHAISPGLAKAIIVSKVDDKYFDIHRPLEKDCNLGFFKFDDPEGKHCFWHSSAHILGQALEIFYNEPRLCLGPAIDSGFYYDVSIEEKVSETDYETLEAIVNNVIKEKQPFERVELKKEDALKMFEYNKYKIEIINKVPDGDTISCIRCGSLIDLCHGPHVPDTGHIKAFKVTKNSSAYWLGNQQNDTLQRVYGIAFPDAKQLAEWEELQRQAALRDHRNIGKNQELFFFDPLSPGSCFFLPHGARIYNNLISFLKDEYHKRGFQEVISPNIYSSQLWETSGHWQHFKENMFTFDVEKQPFALKPMNCPGHCVMFGHRTRSYKELPLRFADFGVLHRNEASGALTGLTRVRRFQQDDAHIFCTMDQVEGELQGAVDFFKFVYGVFGFNFTLELSTRPEKYLGEIEDWNKAEKMMEEVLNASGHPWKLNQGDGAFYGPKIDIHISDAIGRAFQCATIQLDFQLPIKFKLEYVNDKTEPRRPVIIHRAIFGSVERFLAILIEHTAGKWPFWVSPRQVIVCPVSEKFNDYGESVRQQIHDAGYYVDLDTGDKTLKKKILEAQTRQYNYILVVGQKEMETNTVNIRTRDNEVHGEKSVEVLLEELKQNVVNHK